MAKGRPREGVKMNGLTLEGVIVGMILGLGLVFTLWLFTPAIKQIRFHKPITLRKKGK